MKPSRPGRLRSSEMRSPATIAAHASFAAKWIAGLAMAGAMATYRWSDASDRAVRRRRGEESGTAARRSRNVTVSAPV